MYDARLGEFGPDASAAPAEILGPHAAAAALEARMQATGAHPVACQSPLADFQTSSGAWAATAAAAGAAATGAAAGSGSGSPAAGTGPAGAGGDEGGGGGRAQPEKGRVQLRAALQLSGTTASGAVTAFSWKEEGEEECKQVRCPVLPCSVNK